MQTCSVTNGLTVTPSAKELCEGASPLSGGGCYEISSVMVKHLYVLPEKIRSREIVECI